MPLRYPSPPVEFTTINLAEAQANIRRKASSNPLPFLQVSRTTTVRGLLLVTTMLVGLHLLVVASFITGVDFPQKMTFYFDREANIPTYFSSFLLLFAASILAVIATLKRAEHDPLAIRWLLLAIVFLGLSLDEAVSFHELLIEPLRHRFQTSGVLRFPWVVAGATFVLGFGVFYLPFLRTLTRPMLQLFVASAAVYLTGVLGLEMVGGYFYVDYSDFSASSWLYIVAMTLEETFEMLGLILFIHTLLSYLKAYRPALKLTFS